MQMVDKPLVSIIIPVYNREKVVLNTLESISGNRYRPIEMVLVNDGSTDNSLKVLELFKKQHQNKTLTIKIFDQKNQGAPVARNLGYANSNGEYIQFLDSDDYIDPDKLISQVTLMENQNADFGLCDFIMKYIENNKTIYHSNVDLITKVVKSYGSFGCGSPLQTRALADKVSWNEGLPRKQDVDYFLKSALMSNKIAYINKPLYTYVRSTEDDSRISASYDKNPPVFKQRIKSLQEISVPSHNQLFKNKAILNLYLAMVKFKIKKLYEKTFFRHRHNRSSF